MVSTYSYNSERQLTGLTYPSSWDGSTWSPGPSRSVQYDLMGRPKKLINTATSADVVTTTTYGVMGQILTMNGPGMDSETREYNSIGQMTRLVAGFQDVHYNYPSTGNNGKVTSEDRKWSTEPTETVTYTYDSLNRLATAVSSDNPGWGQSFGYDGFGNLTNVSVTKGSAPSLSVSYSASTNRRTSDCADANGNISPCGQTYTWDVSNRLTSVPVSGGTMRYSYDTANRRIWRGSSSTDELTYYAASGSKMVVYNLTTSGSDLRATSTETHEYFNGRKLGGAADGLGSYGRYYPYGQDRPANPSNPSNGTEKFATYKRDSETGLDYAVNRYHSPGDGRFLSPDPYQASAGPGDPGSWNRYAYVGGDPINRFDPAGLQDIPVFTVDHTECSLGSINPACGGLLSRPFLFNTCTNAVIPIDGGLLLNCFPYTYDEACSNFNIGCPEPTIGPDTESGQIPRPSKFQECMEENAQWFSLAGVVDIALKGATGKDLELRDNVVIDFLLGNGISSLVLGSRADAGIEGFQRLVSGLSQNVFRPALSFGRRTAEIMSLNLPGGRGLPRALGGTPAFYRYVAKLAKVLESASIPYKEGIDALFFGALNVFCGTQ